MLVVVGRRGADAERDLARLGSNVERAVRGAHRPVLIAAKSFDPIHRAVIAWDGGRSAAAAIKFIASTSILTGIDTTLLHVGDLRGAEELKIEAVQSQLRAAKVPVSMMGRSGAVAAAIVDVVTALPAQLLVMGAHRHSRIMQHVVGSTTTDVLLSCPSSLLVFP